MLEIGQLASWIAFGFTAGMAITVASQMLNGRINTRYMLWGRRNDGERYFSPERVQLLGFTLWAALSYLSQVMQNASSGSLPDVPAETLALLGGSHGLYLGRKAYVMLWKK